jgi:hypothetical protein
MDFAGFAFDLTLGWRKVVTSSCALLALSRRLVVKSSSVNHTRYEWILKTVFLFDGKRLVVVKKQRSHVLMQTQSYHSYVFVVSC